jgi:SAM-dependent methyltransferase
MAETIIPPPGKGVRYLTMYDQKPDCEMFVNDSLFDIADLAKNGKRVVDIGCGYGKNKKRVEDAGGIWIGVEPFEGGAHTVVGSAENLPFDNETFDIALMTSVMEHVQDVGASYKEISRVLKKGGVFVGYSAFMECFHEISYNHLSFKGIEYYCDINGMKLEKISGGRRFGIDYHLMVLLNPIPIKRLRGFIAWNIRTHLKLKSKLMYLVYRFKNKMSVKDASEKSDLFFKLECLRQSNGFNHIIRKL